MNRPPPSAARRHLLVLAAGAALHAGGCAQAADGTRLAQAPTMPPPEPESLERRIALRAHYIVAATPLQFWLLPREAVSAYFRWRTSDPGYARLINQGAAEPEVRAYVHAQAPAPLRLAQAGPDLRGDGTHYLEFEWTAVLFRKADTGYAMGERGPRLFVPLGPLVSTDRGYRAEWKRRFGAKGILFTTGAPSPREATYVPLEVPVHRLSTAMHPGELLPIPYHRLPTIEAIARAKGFIPVDRP